MAGISSILKARWPEALLIVGLDTAANFTMLQVFEQGPGSQATAPIAAFLGVCFWVVSKLLLYGFVRTSFVDGTMRYEPSMLVKIGYNFFWRMVGIEIIVGLMAFMIGLLLSAPVSSYLMGDVKFSEMQPDAVAKYVKINMICMLIAQYLLVKPALLGPANMIVWQCGVFESFSRLSLHRVLTAGKVLFLYTLLQGWKVLAVLFPITEKEDMLLTYIAGSITSFIAASLTLVCYLAAVQVAGQKYFSIEQAIAPEHISQTNPRKEEVEE